MRPRIPPAPATYDYQDQQELRRVISEFINVNTDVQADPNEIAAPRFSAIKQSAGATPATQTDVVLTIENGGGWGGTLTVWTNPSSPNDADATLAADGTFAVPSCPAAIGPTTLFNLTGGGTGNLLNDVGVHPGRGKRIYALFEDVNGSSTGIWSFVLTSQSGPVDATNTLLPNTVGSSQLVDASVINAKIADAAVTVAKHAAGTRPVEILGALPAAGTQGRTVFLTTDSKLYRDTGAAWTAVVPTTDLTGQVITAQIADGAIVAQKLFIGNFDNLAEDPGFERGGATWGPASGWSIIATGIAHSGANAAVKTGGAAATDFLNANYVDCKPGDNFYLEAWVRSSGVTDGVIAVQLYWYNSSKTFINQSAGNAIANDGVYHLSSKAIAAPAGAAYVRGGFTLSGYSTGTWVCDDMYMRRAVEGSIVVDGTITAAKIAADTITAGQIAAGAITTSELAARAVSLEKLFVGSFDNLILDPGAEQATTLATDYGWSTNGFGASGGTVSITTSSPRSGNQCILFNVSGQTSAQDFAANGRAATIAHAVAATEGDTFYFEMWCRKLGTGAAASPYLYMRFMNASGGTITNTVGSPLAPTTTYQKMTLVATAPAGTSFVQFTVEIPSGGVEHLLFDDAYARRMVTGSIVVDGTITATKIAVTQLSAITADMGTVTAGVVRDANSKFVVNLSNALLQVFDNQAVPVQRVTLGKVAGGTIDYGLRVSDANGSTVADFTGANRILAVPLQDQGTKSADFTLNLSTGLTQIVQLGASGLNLTFSNPVDGGRYRIWFQQDPTGSRTFPNITNAVMFTNDTAPVLTTTPGALDLFEFEYRASPIARFTCMPLQTNVLLPTPQVVSVTPFSDNVATLNHNISMPATVAAGDLLLVICCFSGSSSRTPPAGWTALYGSGVAGAFYKIASGSEGGTSPTFTTVGSETLAAQTYRINRWYGQSAGISASGGTGIAGTSGDPNSLGPLGWTDRTLWFAALGINALNTVNVDPTNYSNAQATDASTNARLRVLRRVLYAATENPSAFSWTGSTNWGVGTIAVRPPA